jgi:ubiquinone/menaquinone biosynthesis C-methylase UbiE
VSAPAVDHGDEAEERLRYVMIRSVLCTAGKTIMSLMLATSCRESVTPAKQQRATTSATAVSAPTVQASPAPSDGTYMGRPLAQTMSHLGASWLTRQEREQEERTSKMIPALQLQPGQTACDLGAGNGYHTLMMARAVMPGGIAIAVDIQPQMLPELTARAKAANVNNVQTVLGEEQDPKLAAATCDLILLADVYHEFSNPAAMLQKIKYALKSNGVVALLEFRAEDPDVPIKPEHKMTKEQILKEYEAGGLRLVRSVDSLPWQHLMFFRRN